MNRSKGFDELVSCFTTRNKTFKFVSQFARRCGVLATPRRAERAAIQREDGLPAGRAQPRHRHPAGGPRQSGRRAEAVQQQRPVAVGHLEGALLLLTVLQCVTISIRFWRSSTSCGAVWRR